jgi:20S proteasome subunit beta 2
LILGGYDCLGPHLVSIHPAGSTSYMPYVSMGSGSLNATAILDVEFRPDLEVYSNSKLEGRRSQITCDQSY